MGKLRDKVIEQAFHDCMKEMYAKAQPSLDYDLATEQIKSGEMVDTKEDPVYGRHYLSHDEFKYILDKYIDGYNIKSKWLDYVGVVEKYLTKGGTKDKYIERDGDNPGYRGYEEVAPIREQIQNILKESTGNDSDELTNKIVECVLNTISDCKKFYKFDKENLQFSMSVALGHSPSSSLEKVQKYWDDKGVDIKIVERNPLLMWDRDYYGDEFEEVMEEEYGKDWEKIWDDKWKDDISKMRRRKKHFADLKNQKEQ